MSNKQVCSLVTKDMKMNKARAHPEEADSPVGRGCVCTQASETE